MKALWKEFKAFITRGSVVDMSIAVIIGSAFTAIVTSFTNDIIMPLINLAMGGHTMAGQCVVLNGVPKYVTDATTGTQVINPEAITWNYGNFIQSIIKFLIIALILFAILKTVTSIRKRLDVRATIQGKLDNDEKLTDLEEKLLKSMQKKNPATAPKKKQPEPEAPKAPTEAELLARMCELLEENNKLQKETKETR